MIPKFRAWDKESKEMYACYGFNTFDTKNKLFICNKPNSSFKNGKLQTIRAIEVFADNYILMQSTGLKDKNGVEIYEHDILKNGNGKIGEVIYLQQEVGYVVSLKRSDYRLGHRNTGEGYKIANDHTVIGNIYENPGLLEVTK